ncbi:MAG: PilZ domain-containing protein, partial [Nitrospiraceae bacterium]
AMELMLPVLPEEDCFVPRMDLRRYVRKAVHLGIIFADKGGFASGEVIDLTTRGCGLRLILPLVCGQCLTLKLYPGNGTSAVICDLVQVQWVKEGRAGLVFLSMSLENELRLHRLCDEYLLSKVED